MQHDGTLLPQTAQEEHFIYLSLPYLALYTSLQSLPEKNCLSAKISVWKGGPFPFPSALGYFYPRPSTSPCPRPSIPPSPGYFPAPICTLLVTLSTYLVPTECLCNQTYTYPVVRHSNGRLIMKLHRCELTTGEEMYKFCIASTRLFMRVSPIFEEAAFSAIHEWIGPTNWLSGFIYLIMTHLQRKTSKLLNENTQQWPFI